METEAENNVIYSYGDKQALDDGMLLDISGMGIRLNGLPVNRITGNCWSRFKDSERADLLLEAVVNVAEKTEDDYMFTSNDGRGKKLWFVKNEVEGYTLMYPEDY